MGMDYTCQIELGGRVLTSFRVSKPEAEKLALNFGMPWPFGCCATTFGDITVILGENASFQPPVRSIPQEQPEEVWNPNRSGE